MRRHTQQLVVALFACSVAMQLLGCRPPGSGRPPPIEHAAPPANGRAAPFTATAYSGGRKTASGTAPEPGIVAADPSVLPLGSRVRVSGAGPYSGDYVVRDTGRLIHGNKIDIYMPTRSHAKRFGRRRVKIEVIGYGQHRRRAHHARRRHRSARHRRYARAEG